MKKILFLLLITVSMHGQTYQNPTFGTITTKTNVESATATKINAQETDGKINWLQPINIPIPIVPVNYSVSSGKLGSHLQGIDTRLGQISSTTAGLTQRIYFTADNTTVNSIVYFASSATGKGSTSTGSPPNLVLADNTKGYFTKDIIGIAQPSPTIGYAGTYSGNLTVSATPTPVATQQRFTVEVYRTDNLGNPIASGVSGAPVGDLGVTVVAILDSGIINLNAGSITNVSVSGILTQNITINTGERLRYHVSAAKIGTGGGNVTFGVYYGNSYNSYYDVPVAITTDAVLNKSTVSGVTDTDALNNLKTADQQLAGVGVPFGHVSDGAQTIAGVKTFSSSPIVPTLSLGDNSTKVATSEFVAINDYANTYNSIPFGYKYNDAQENPSVLVIGDSNYDTPDRMMLPFLKSFIKERASRGIGYFSFNASAETMGMNTPTYSGTWTNKDIFNSGKGIDGRSITSNVLNSEITLTPSTTISTQLAKIDNMRVFYLKGASGELEYSVNSGSYTTVVLSTSPANGLGSFDIPVPLSSSWTVKIRLKTGSVELLGGVASNNTDRGILMNKCAHWGSASSHYASLSAQSSWTSMISNINPDILIIGLSTNEFNNGVPLSTTKANFTTLINNIKSTLKGTAIYISIPPKSDDVIVPPTSVTAKMSSDMLTALAKELKIGYIPIFNSWEKYDNTYTDGLYVDGVHYNSKGAALNAGLLRKYIGLTTLDIYDNSGNYIHNQESISQSATMRITGKVSTERGLSLLDGESSPIIFSKGGITRSLMRIEDSNGDFNIFQYDATGAYLRTAFNISNATGVFSIASLSGSSKRVMVADASGQVLSDGIIPLKAYTVATLPSGAQGDTAYVTDAVSPTYLGTLTGGGSVVCPVFYNGTTWVSH